MWISMYLYVDLRTLTVMAGFATSTTTAQPSTSRPATDSQTAPADVLSSLEAAVEALSHAMIGTYIRMCYTRSL